MARPFDYNVPSTSLDTSMSWAVFTGIKETYVLGDIAKFKMLVRGPPKEGDYLTIKESKTPKKSDRHGSQRIWMIAAIAPRVKSNQYNMTVKLQHIKPNDPTLKYLKKDKIKYRFAYIAATGRVLGRSCEFVVNRPQDSPFVRPFGSLSIREISMENESVAESEWAVFSEVMGRYYVRETAAIKVTVTFKPKIGHHVILKRVDQSVTNGLESWALPEHRKQDSFPHIYHLFIRIPKITATERHQYHFVYVTSNEEILGESCRIDIVKQLDHCQPRPTPTRSRSKLQKCSIQ